MGRELQKKKKRSGRQPVRTTNRPPKNPLTPLGNSTIAKNWDKTQTLAQNYRRIGLTSRLKAPSGGTETKLGTKRTASKAFSGSDGLAIAAPQQAILSEAKVERDENGKIIRIISRTAINPLNDPLNDLDSDSEAEEIVEDTEEWGGIEEEGNEVLRTLLEESQNAAPKKERHQSGREKEWLENLVEKHGDNYMAMARDPRLNPMQQTASDIKKRISKLKTKA